MDRSDVSIKAPFADETKCLMSYGAQSRQSSLFRNSRPYQRSFKFTSSNRSFKNFTQTKEMGSTEDRNCSNQELIGPIAYSEDPRETYLAPCAASFSAFIELLWHDPFLVYLQLFEGWQQGSV